MALKAYAWLGSALLAWSMGGCVAEDPRQRGVVLLDAEARASGAVIEQAPELKTRSALPVSVDPERPVSVRNGNVYDTFWVAPGELTLIQGRELALERQRFGRDIATDRVLVAGTPDAVARLTADVAGTLQGRPDSPAELRADHVYTAAALAEADGIDEVAPVPVTSASPSVDTRFAAHSDLRSDARTTPDPLDGRSAPFSLSELRRTLSAELDPVGIYGGPGGRLVLDAGLGYRACGAEFAGLGARGSYTLEGERLTLTPAHGEPRGFVLSADGTLTGLAQNALFSLTSQEASDR